MCNNLVPGTRNWELPTRYSPGLQVLVLASNVVLVKPFPGSLVDGGMNSSNNINDSTTIWESNEVDYTIPQLPSHSLLVARIVFACCGVVSNVIVLLIFAQCRRLHHPRHTCWMAVTVAALLVHLLAVIEMLSAAYPSRPAYTFLLVFKGTPFAFFSLGYTLIAVERHLAVSHYLW